MTPADGFLQVSSDGGRTWKQFGNRLPVNVVGMDYYVRGKTLYIYSNKDTSDPSAIMKMRLTKNP